MNVDGREAIGVLIDWHFEFRYGGSGLAQLAAIILNEITDDPELTCTYYQLFKFDPVPSGTG